MPPLFCASAGPAAARPATTVTAANSRSRGAIASPPQTQPSAVPVEAGRPCSKRTGWPRASRGKLSHSGWVKGSAGEPAYLLLLLPGDGISLAVQPDIFHAPARADAVDHDRQ